MKQLTIISGAGINLAISAACPAADQMLNFTYQRISTSVYEKIKPEIRAMFTPESFDYILGGLLTINLAIEKTKEDLKRFQMNEKAFSDLFKQSELQSSIIDALDSIEKQLTISLSQILNITSNFAKPIDNLFNKYQSINYYTLNFDGIFDHIIYGKNYSRKLKVTDFWNKKGTLAKSNKSQAKIFHLHGDLRYKPFKKTKHNIPPFRWPVLVVGDNDVKKGIIASNESLTFYHNRLRSTCEKRIDSSTENNLAIIGFGFRSEDEHIIANIRDAIKNKIFDNIYLYDVSDKLSGISNSHKWVAPSEKNLIEFIGEL